MWETGVTENARSLLRVQLTGHKNSVYMELGSGTSQHSTSCIKALLSDCMQIGELFWSLSAKSCQGFEWEGACYHRAKGSRLTAIDSDVSCLEIFA